MLVKVERIPNDTLPMDESNPGCGWHFVFSADDNHQGFRFTIPDVLAKEFGVDSSNPLSVLRAVVMKGRDGETVAP